MPTRTVHRWTSEQDAELVTMVGDGTTDREIGRALGGLTKRQVKHRRGQLGLAGVPRTQAKKVEVRVSVMRFLRNGWTLRRIARHLERNIRAVVDMVARMVRDGLLRREGPAKARWGVRFVVLGHDLD